jgi:hypothetical protein
MAALTTNVCGRDGLMLPRVEAYAIYACVVTGGPLCF